MPEEDIETAELKEHLDEGIEEAEEAHEHAHKAGGGHGGAEKEKPKSSWTRYLSLSTAIIAVFAAVASLESGANSNEAILAKSQAMLDQSTASDQWGLFQAKGIKAAISLSQSRLSAAQPELAKQFADDAARQQKDAADAKKAAEDLEAEEHKDNMESADMMEHHHHFAIAVTLLQIAIAMSAIAALTRRKPLWYLGMGVSVGGLAMFLWGLF